MRWTTGNEYLYALSHAAATALAGSDHAMTVYLVFKRGSARVATDYPFRFASNGHPNALHNPIGIAGAANNVVSTRTDDAASNVTLTSAGAGDASAFHVWTAKFTGTAMTIYKDGGTGIASITGAAMNVGTCGLDAIFCGASGSFIGDLALGLVYSTSHADTPRHEIQNALGAKYGITIT